MHARNLEGHLDGLPSRLVLQICIWIGMQTTAPCQSVLEVALCSGCTLMSLKSQDHDFLVVHAQPACDCWASVQALPAQIQCWHTRIAWCECNTLKAQPCDDRVFASGGVAKRKPNTASQPPSRLARGSDAASISIQPDRSMQHKQSKAGSSDNVP